jgi:hypothetical protein
MMKSVSFGVAVSTARLVIFVGMLFPCLLVQQSPSNHRA